MGGLTEFMYHPSPWWSSAGKRSAGRRRSHCCEWTGCDVREPGAHHGSHLDNSWHGDADAVRSASRNDTAFGGSIRGASHGARAPGRSFVHSARRAATPTRRRPTSGMLPVSGGYPQNYAMAANVQLGGQRPSAPVVNKVVAKPMMQPAIFERHGLGQWSWAGEPYASAGQH